MLDAPPVVGAGGVQVCGLEKHAVPAVRRRVHCPLYLRRGARRQNNARAVAKLVLLHQVPALRLIRGGLDGVGNAKLRVDDPGLRGGGVVAFAGGSVDRGGRGPG